MPRKKTAKRPKKSDRKIAVIDFETDPFKFGREPKAFAAGFYDGETYEVFWGDDCALQLIVYLESRRDPLLIYAHNGGKFDFYYLLEQGALTNPAMLINGRIVKCGLLGIHELRDSFAILPIALAKLGDKKEIDYRKMERDKREKHKAEILEYLKADCIELQKIVQKFQDRFGPKLTIGATAIAQLGKLHRVSRQDEQHDKTFRPFYFGGRVECFESGALEGPFSIYDVNSMYPKAMRDYQHPSGKFYVHLGPEAARKFNWKTGELLLSRRFEVGKGWQEETADVYFIRCRGKNKNAIPVRVMEGPDKGALRFDQTEGEFFACSHELKVALELKLFEVTEIIEIYIPCRTGNFAEFVDTFAAEKKAAKDAQKTDPERIEKHKADETFAKLILNSAYGKFATDPHKFRDWFIVDSDNDECVREFEAWRAENEADDNSCKLVNDMGRFEIWECPNYDIRGFYDVAVAASITSAARSILLRAIAGARRPVYCDTDSLICSAIRGVEIDDALLGAWKFEGMTPRIWIAGKKMYGCLLHDADGKPTMDKKTGKQKEKLASKGAKLRLTDIQELCEGQTVLWNSDAPNFRITGEIQFVSRKIRRNA